MKLKPGKQLCIGGRTYKDSVPDHVVDSSLSSLKDKAKKEYIDKHFVTNKKSVPSNIGTN